MAIENRDLEPGTKLLARYKKEEYRAEVIAGEEGKVMYQLADGREFKSPSSAATAITGKAANGWNFWSVETASVQSEPQESETQGSEDESTEPQTAESISSAEFRRVPNQKGVGDGDVRLYCDSCRASFTAPTDQLPETCPEGHRPDAGQPEATEA